MEMREFQRRRKRLMDMMGDESIAIIPTSPEPLNTWEIRADLQRF